MEKVLFENLNHGAMLCAGPELQTEVFQAAARLCEIMGHTQWMDRDRGFAEWSRLVSALQRVPDVRNAS